MRKAALIVVVLLLSAGMVAWALAREVLVAGPMKKVGQQAKPGRQEIGLHPEFDFLRQGAAEGRGQQNFQVKVTAHLEPAQSATAGQNLGLQARRGSVVQTARFVKAGTPCPPQMSPIAGVKLVFRIYSVTKKGGAGTSEVLEKTYRCSTDSAGHCVFSHPVMEGRTYKAVITGDKKGYARGEVTLYF